jgi:FkbM family methyltransferase
MLHKQIKTAKNNIIDVKSNDNDIVSHFADPANHVDDIIQQLEIEAFYTKLFPGKENLVVLDIGANVGLFSLYFQDQAKMVYSLEPTPGHFSILKRLTANYPKITPLNIALSDQDADIDFFICSNNTTMNSMTARSDTEYTENITVRGVTLATLLDELKLDHVDFIKCDIEGSESFALTYESIGAVKDKVDCWYVECHYNEKGGTYKQVSQTLANIFAHYGYKVSQFTHDGIVAKRESGTITLYV